MSEQTMTTKRRTFPCPYCKGQGGEKDVILDDGTGPWYPCGICLGEGLIEIGGERHRLITLIREGVNDPELVLAAEQPPTPTAGATGGE